MHTQRRPATHRLQIVALALAMVGLLAACGSGGRAASGDIADGPAPDGAVKVVATDNEFSPADLQLPAGQKVTVEVTNEGDAPHNFVIEELDVSTGTIETAEVVTATFDVGQGELTYVCTFHPNMKGQIAAP